MNSIYRYRVSQISEPLKSLVKLPRAEGWSFEFVDMEPTCAIQYLKGKLSQLWIVNFNATDERGISRPYSSYQLLPVFNDIVQESDEAPPYGQ